MWHIQDDGIPTPSLGADSRAALTSEGHAVLTSTAMFIDSLEKWLRAVRADEFGAAKVHAEHLIKAGELLVIHPEFVRAFEEHCHGIEPKQALFELCQFFVCATDGREHALKNWVKKSKPAGG